MTEKLYYTIGEVSEMLRVNPSLIRFWEKEFPILKPQKNKKGNRLFVAGDIENLRLIYHLLKEKGYTIQGARDYLAKNKNEAETKKEIIQSLQKIRQQLIAIDRELA
ncbi:MAG: MerR family transcriptional regulator [Bacteroidales bacterium]|nr:MerR family transcriptional regulator [Bacteroidales bacterium]